MSSSVPTPRPTIPATHDAAENGQAERVNAYPPTPPESPARPRRSRSARRLAKQGESATLTGAQRLLLLDTWRRSGLPAGDFAPLVGISKHTLYAWKHKFETEGPAGLEEKPRGGPTGSRLPEVTKRTILMLKQDNPDWATP